MQSANPPYLARSTSAGLEKRPPPPIKPKPSALVSAPTDSTANNSASSTASSQRPPITVTDNGAPTSTAFGDLKKAFERQQNSSPLFLGGVGTYGSSSRVAGESTSSGHLHHAAVSRIQQLNSSELDVPSHHSRPRSVSSPGPPQRESGSSRGGAPSAGSISSGDGIDNSQPDFGNLRARFQSQASVPNVSLPKPDTPQPKPKTAINSQNPAVAARASRASMDSISTTAPTSTSTSKSTIRHSLPQYPSLAVSSSTSHLSSNSFKQLPRPPPPVKPSFRTKTPSPPRTPTSVETPESERNPFMGSDEDEAGPATPLPARPPLPSRTSSKIQQNPVFQQFNNSAKLTPLVSVPGRDSVLIGKVAPPAPQRAAPRPDSPQELQPKLPSRSNSFLLSAEDTPEEKERKHRLDKRRRVIQELLETEISYSKDLLLLQEVYVTDMIESPLFSQADEKIVFMNLGEVIELSLDFIALLTPACGGGSGEEYNDANTFVGEAFLQMTSRIRRVYSEYCKRQEASAQYLQELDSRKDLKPFFDACQEKCKGKTTTWDLASFLIKPVQRVLKYPLLINQIHALTSHEHADYESLAEVQKDMVQIAEEINEIKKRKDIVEKIVGPKKKTDSDLVHGFNKKFSRTTQQLRQAVGGSDVTVDILFEALLEKFNLQQSLAREFVKYILAWLLSIKQFFDTQEAFALTLREIYSMVPIHRHDENRSTVLVSEFHKSLSQFSKTIGRELEARLKKTVYKSIENFLRLFSGPLQVMKKREKKLLDYDSVRGMKERGDTIDKNMLESAEAYTAINEQLVDELPVFLGLTTQYFDLIVMEFSRVQMYFYSQVKGKILEFYIQNIDSTVSMDVPGYMATMNICEDYITAMQRDDGPLARLERVSLIRNVESTHEMAFQSMRETAQRRKRASLRLASRSGSSSSVAPLPLHTPGSERSSWFSKSTSKGDLLTSPTDVGLHQLPMLPRFFPGDDDNPFEMPESIFHDGSVISDEYEPFGNNHGGNQFGVRPLSVASSAYSFSSGAGGGGFGSEYQDPMANTKPPALDEGMDADEIGIAQALFECTAIYPYTSTEARQLSFEAGESIVVFGLNDDGWYFGKKVGKETTGWFPASHCIQI